MTKIEKKIQESKNEKQVLLSMLIFTTLIVVAFYIGIIIGYNKADDDSSEYLDMYKDRVDSLRLREHHYFLLTLTKDKTIDKYQSSRIQDDKDSLTQYHTMWLNGIIKQTKNK